MDKKDEVRTKGMEERKKFVGQFSRLVRDAASKGVFGLDKNDFLKWSVNVVEKVEPKTNKRVSVPGDDLTVELKMTFSRRWWDEVDETG